MNFDEILENLPYNQPFLFVDNLEHIDDTQVIGGYTFKANSKFYEGHFKGHPVTPGVILTECCAQIGLVCLGIYLLKDELNNNLQIGMSSSDMEFLIPVYPNEKVKVIAEKVYFRFQKLKCKVKMYDSQDRLVCRGTISGMINTIADEK